MRRQIAHGESDSVVGGAELGLVEQPRHVQRRPVHRQVFAELLDPVVGEVEVHSSGQGVERLEVLDVDGERCVAAAAGFAAGPFRAGDHRDRARLGVGVGDALFLTALGQMRQPLAGALLQLEEALDRQPAVGGPGQRQV